MEPRPEPWAAAAAAEGGDRERLLDLARKAGDRVERLLGEGGAGGAGWRGSRAAGGGSFSPALGIDLYGGMPGIALFFAYLAAATLETRYLRSAEKALAALRRQAGEGRKQLRSIGAFSGWGGVIYALLQLGTLWSQPALLQEAEGWIELLPRLVPSDEELDLLRGAAGCIGCLLAFHRQTGSALALETARGCGEHLLRRAQPVQGGLAWIGHTARRPLTGFARGGSGFAWALAALGRSSGDARFDEAARAALVSERRLLGHESRGGQRPREQPGEAVERRLTVSWCQGAPGIGMARLGMLEQGEDRVLREELAEALGVTLARGFEHDDSLCHGRLGSAELLLLAGERLGDPAWEPIIRRVAGGIAAAIEQHGWRCGLPSGTESLGLMTGIAGIGYGLLRLAEPEWTPSILLLEPPRCLA